MWCFLSDFAVYILRPITLAVSFVSLGALDNQLFNECLLVRIELGSELWSAIEIKLHGITPDYPTATSRPILSSYISSSVPADSSPQARNFTKLPIALIFTTGVQSVCCIL